MKRIIYLAIITSIISCSRKEIPFQGVSAEEVPILKERIYKGDSWKKRHFTWGVKNKGLYITKTQLTEVCRKAFNEWEKGTTVRFLEVPWREADFVIEVTPHVEEKFLAKAFFPGPAKHAGYIILKENLNWGKDPLGGKYYDPYPVIAHEIGHSLGLLHIDDRSSIMYPKANASKGKISIKDRKAINIKYKEQ